MLNIPTLPLAPERLEDMRFAVAFFEKPGFYDVYEQELAKIWPVGRGRKKGLKRQAYETTEQLYSTLFGCRCFPDVEQFGYNYSKHKRKLSQTLPTGNVSPFVRKPTS